MRISPLPPRAKAGVLSGISHSESPESAMPLAGEAIAVLAPFNNIMALLNCDAFRTALIRSGNNSAQSGNNRLNSPT